jgi:LDH2 family malate/lactate/ureidoglycolate dehydrogenase
MRVDAFRPAAEFKANMDTWISRFRQATPVAGQKVLIPGDPEREMEKERRAQGIPVLEPVVKDLEEVAARFQLKFA